MARLLSVGGIVALLLLNIQSGTAAAQGHRLKGSEIDRSLTVSGVTGNCSCDRKWYTLGLRPGRLDLTATLKSRGRSMGPTYGLLGYLLQGGLQLQSGQAACYTSKIRCDQSFVMTYKITHAGVYYVLMRGAGAEGITYSLRVRGAVYPLHCRITC